MREEYLIGRLILAWTPIEQAIFRFANVGLARPGMQSEEQEPEKRAKRRLAAWRRRYLSYLTDEAQRKQVEKIYTDLLRISEMRNDLAHNVVGYDTFDPYGRTAFRVIRTISRSEEREEWEKQGEKMQAALAAKNIRKLAKLRASVKKQHETRNWGRLILFEDVEKAITRLQQIQEDIAALYWDAVDATGTSAWHVMRQGKGLQQ